MKILNKKYQRQLTILEKLSIRDYTIKEISYIFNTKESVIENYIGEINNEYYPIKIQKEEDATLHLHIPEGLSFKTIYSLALKQSLEFNILETIFFSETHSYLSLASELFISETTVKRKVLALRKSFQKQNLDIDIATKPLKIIGNEKTITEFFVAYFRERYPVDEFPFPKTLLLKAESVARELLQLYRTMNFGDFRRFKLWILVNYTREQNGHPIGEYLPMKKQELFWDNLETLMTDEQIHQILIHGIPANVLARTFHIFSSLKYAFNYEMIDKLCKLDQRNLKRFLATTEYIKKIAATFKIEMTEERFKQLQLRFFNILGLLENSNMPGQIIDNYPEKFVKHNRWIEEKNFSHLQKLYLECFTDKKLCSPYFQYEALYSTVTFWEELFFSLQKANSKTKMGLIFDSSPEYPIFVARQLSYYFGEKVESEIIPALTIDEIKAAMPNYDYILTNIPFDYESQKVICVEKTIQIKDFIKIFEIVF